MRLMWLKILWSILTKPRCIGSGNLSSMDCGRCRKLNACATGSLNGRPRVFFWFSKPGEAYPYGRMNSDSMCNMCAYKPWWSFNPKYCKGCLDDGIHTNWLISKKEAIRRAREGRQ